MRRTLQIVRYRMRYPFPAQAEASLQPAVTPIPCPKANRSIGLKMVRSSVHTSRLHQWLRHYTQVEGLKQDGSDLKLSALREGLSIHTDTATLPEITYHVPMNRGIVLASCLQESLPKRQVNGTTNLLVEQRIARE
jgi:hypothetical protein